MSASRKLAMAVTIPALLFAALQLVPYGRNHAAPPDGKVAAFDSPRTEELARRACFDCHSNRTKWPWYASIAPISWRMQSHVDEGRAALNFSALDTLSEKGVKAAGKAGEETSEGEMPLKSYLLMHPEARLTAAEMQDLARGLDRTFAAFVERGGEDATGRGGRTPGEREKGESAEHERAEQERGEESREAGTSTGS
jgi:mono/diheme cytochrome c family protein